MQKLRDDDVLRDGESLRVPVSMMDAEQRAVAVARAPHRPYQLGALPVFDTAAGAARRADARDAYVRALADAWRGPRP